MSPKFRGWLLGVVSFVTLIFIRFGDDNGERLALGFLILVGSAALGVSIHNLHALKELQKRGADAPEGSVEPE